MSDQTPRVAVITGASQGIGASLVPAYRKLGYAVLGTSRTIGPSDDPMIATVRGDIATADTAERVTREAIERFGRIDTLINNAGVFVAKRFTQYTDEEYELSREGEPRRVLPHHPSRDRADGAARWRPRGQHHHHARRARRRESPVGPGVADQGRAGGCDEVAGDRVRRDGHPRERRDVVSAIMYLETAPFVTGEYMHVDGGQRAGH